MVVQVLAEGVGLVEPSGGVGWVVVGASVGSSGAEGIAGGTVEDAEVGGLDGRASDEVVDGCMSTQASLDWWRMG